MRFPDQHLNADEIELLAGEGDLSDELRSGLSEAREHVGVCEDCRQIVSAYRDMGSTMETLRNPGGAHKQPDCPSLDVWLQVAGGLLTPAENDKYLDHAAQCDYCGSVLAEVWKDSRAPAAKHEQLQLDHLATLPLVVLQPEEAFSEYQSIRTTRSSEKWNYRVLLWLGSVAVIAMVIGSFALLQHRRQRPLEMAKAMLAEAYKEDRIIEPRLMETEYAPMVTTLGANNSHLNHPAALLDAESLIHHQLETHPDDGQWLDQKGRAELMEKDYEAALRTLTHASEMSHDSNIIIDLASAYYQRAVEQDRTVDYGQSAELLSTVLINEPRNRIALFNRALSFERMHDCPSATKDWTQYLKLDPVGGWATEAKRHLLTISPKCSRSSLPQLLSASAIASCRNEDSLYSELETHIDEYLDLAIKQWLPARAQVIKSDQRYVENDKALAILAKLLIMNHGDRWLSDTVTNANKSGSQQGFVALSRALYYTDISKPDSAYKAAKNAATSFLLARNFSAYVRAELEAVHALQRSENGRECRKKAVALEKQLSGLKYYWIRGQLEIDEGACFFKTGSFGQAESTLAHAIRTIRVANFKTLLLRAIGIQAGLLTAGGDIVGGWKKDSDGLASYWDNAQTSPMRAHQFYDDLAYSAEDMKEWNLARSLAEQDVSVISQTKDIAGEALTRQHLGLIYLTLGDFQNASKELVEAQELFKQLNSPGNTGVLTESEIGLARTELNLGNLEGAASRLESLKPGLASISNITFPLRFYNIWGDLNARQGRFDEARKSYQTGILIGDQKLVELDDPIQRFTWSQEAAPLYRKLIEIELRNQQVTHALSLWEWFRSASIRRKEEQFQKLNPFFNSAPLDQLLSSLKGKTFISYAFLSNGLAVWVFDDRGVYGQILQEDPEQLERLMKHFNELCSNPSSDVGGTKARGHELYKKLIAPISNRLHAGRTLFIDADDLMSDLPFAALVDDEGHYLIERYSLAFSPGLLVGQYLRPIKPLTDSSQVVVVGSTATLPALGLFSVPNVETEAAEVANEFYRPRLLVGVNASFAIVEPVAVNAEIFHYVGHALSTVKEEGLLLSGTRPDEGTEHLWSADRLSHGRAFTKATLVVLSACSTGRANQGRVETHGELVRALLHKRVPQIIVTRWDISLTETTSFMITFYDNFRKGKSVATALRASALDVMRKKPAPYYWAGLAEIGK